MACDRIKYYVCCICFLHFFHFSFHKLCNILSQNTHFQQPAVMMAWVEESQEQPERLQELTALEGVGDIVALQLRDGINIRSNAIENLLCATCNVHIR